MKNSRLFGGIPSPKFVSQFRTQALRFKGGKELLERLEGLSCGLDLLLMFVQLHVGSRVESPTRAAIRAHTSSKKKIVETLASLRRDVTKLAQRAEDTNKAVAQELARFVLDQPFQLPDAMRSYATQLAAIEATVSKQVRHVSERWEKMRAVRMVAELLRTDAGKPDYPAIARVLEIGYLAFGVKQTVGRRDAKKLVKGAEKLMAEEIKSAEWSASPYPHYRPDLPC